MKHPIFSGSGLRFYLLVWGVVILIQFSFLFFYLDSSLTMAIADSIVYNTLFAAFGIGLWYVVKYASLNNDELALIATHLGASLITISLWTATGNLILQPFVNGTEIFFDTYIWRWIIGILFYCIIVLVFYLIKYYRDMQERLKSENELHVLLKDAELKMLKSQINPHFIFNSLNSISALTISKADRAREMVIKLSEFLRYSLGKSSLEMNTIQEEVKSVALYLDIEKIRFGDKLQFDSEVSNECLHHKIPNLILQPIIENAVKYGIYDSTDQSTISLICERVQSLLYISVVNSYDPDTISTPGEGIGLRNVRKRLTLVYGRSDLLEVAKMENQFKTLLKIPIMVENE